MRDTQQGRMVLMDEGKAIGVIMPETELSPARADFTLVMVILSSKESSLKIGSMYTKETSGLRLITEPVFVFEKAAT